MTRIALIALLTATAAAPAFASEPLMVTVSDRAVPAFLLTLEAEDAGSSLNTTPSSRDDAGAPGHSPRAVAIFTQLAAESSGDS